MFANRLQAPDSRKGSSTSLWLTGIVVGGSVISLYYFHRLRRSAILSQSSAEQSSSSDVLQRHELQVILVVHGVSDSELQELVDASFELGVQDVWVIHGGGLQTEDIAKLSGGSAHIRIFETAIECCKALQTEQWDMYIGSKAALPTSHQTSEESFTPDSKSAVVISAADVPQCFLQAAKKTFHAGRELSSPDLLRYALQQLANTPALEVEATRSRQSSKPNAGLDLPLSTSVHFDTDAETDGDDAAAFEHNAGDDSHTAVDSTDAYSSVPKYLAGSGIASSPRQTTSEPTVAQQDSGSEQSQTSHPGLEAALTQDKSQLNASSPHAQPSPVPTSPSSSHSSGSVTSQSPSQHSSSPGLLTGKQSDSKPTAQPLAHRQSPGAERSHSSASAQTQSSASTHTQSSASTHTQSPGSASHQSLVADSPESPSELSKPDSSLTEQAAKSAQHAAQDPAGRPDKPLPAAQQAAHEDGPSQHHFPASIMLSDTHEPAVGTHTQQVAENSKAATVPRKPWQSSNPATAATASQPATAPFWQRQSSDADSAFSQHAAVPFWLRQGAANATASDDTASVMSEPAGRPFWQRDTTQAAKAGSDNGSVKLETGEVWSKGSAGTAHSVPNTTSAAAVVPFWQRTNRSMAHSRVSDTASVQSGSASVPFWQRQQSTDTATSQPVAIPSRQTADPSSVTATSQPSTAPFWQSRNATSGTAASASARNLSSWQGMQAGTAAPLTSQASSSSIASSSRGSGLGGHATASTAQRALFEGQGSSPSSSRAPLQSYLGNANTLAAGSSPASNSQISDIAKLQAQAMRRSGVLRRHVGDSRTGSSLGSPTGSVASVATSGWPDTPSSHR